MNIKKLLRVQDLELPKDKTKFAEDIIKIVLANTDSELIVKMCMDNELHAYLREVINQSFKSFVGISIPDISDDNKLIGDDNNVIVSFNDETKFESNSFGNATRLRPSQRPQKGKK